MLSNGDATRSYKHFTHKIMKIMLNKYLLCNHNLYLSDLSSISIRPKKIIVIHFSWIQTESLLVYIGKI